jgi:hypothetical protein
LPTTVAVLTAFSMETPRAPVGAMVLRSAGSSPQNTSSEAPTHPPAHAAAGSRQIRPFPVRGSDNDLMRRPPPALAAAAVKMRRPQRNVRRRGARNNLGARELDHEL